MFSAGLLIFPPGSGLHPNSTETAGLWGSGNVPARPVSATPTTSTLPDFPSCRLVQPPLSQSQQVPPLPLASSFRQPHRIYHPLPSPSRQIRDAPLPLTIRERHDRGRGTSTGRYGKVERHSRKLGSTANDGRRRARRHRPVDMFTGRLGASFIAC